MAAQNNVEIIISAVDKTKAALTSASQGIDRLRKETSTALGDLGAAVAVTALVAFGRAVLDSMDRLDEMAQKTGIGAESLSTLGAAAEHEGVSVDGFGKGLAKLAQNMVGAASGSGASAAAFARLGVSVKNAAGQMRPTEDVLLDLAEQFKSMPDGAQKSALAMELFGKAGVDMIPFLNQGRDGIEALKQKYRELGVEIDGPTAAAAAQFNDTLHTAGQALKGIATQIVAAALPAMQSLADALLSIASNGKTLIPIVTELGKIILLAFGARAVLAVASFATSLGKMGALWRTATLAGAAYAAIRFFEFGASVKQANEDTARLTDTAKKGAAETALLVRAANELNANGALSLQTQLDLAALSAQKVRDNLPAIATTLGQVGQTAVVVGEQIRAALSDQVTRAAGTIKNLSAAYKQVGSDILTELKGRTSQIDASYQAQVQAAQKAARSEADAIARTTQALLQAEQNKLQAVRSAADQANSAWEKTYNAAMDLARAAGEAEIQAARDAGTGIEAAEKSAADRTTAVHRDMVQQKVASYDQIASAYRSTVDKLIAEEQRHLQAAKSAEEARYNLKLSVEDRIRALLQKGMDAGAALADQQKQIDEKQAQAREALSKGDFERARKLAEETLGLIERNATEVTRTVENNGQKTTEVIQSQGMASVKATHEMRESADIADQALAKLAASHTAAGTAAGQGAEQAKSALAGVTAEITSLRQALAEQGKLTISVNTDAARQGIAEIQSTLQAATLLATIQTDTAQAKTSIAALQSDLDNLTLLAKVEADTSQVASGIAALQALVQQTNINLPATADFSAAQSQLNAFAADARTTLSRPTTHTHTVRPDTNRADAAIRELERNTYSTHTIRVRKVEQNALGGLAGSLQRLASGGQALASAAWGRASGRISGPGSDTSDNIPALLSPGEYVIRAASVRRFGQTLFDALNIGHLPAALMPAPLALATGGLIPGLAGLSDTTSSAARDSVDINLRIGSQTLPLQGSRATAQALASALRDLSRGG